MLYKATPFGYFDRTSKVSQGPWFHHSFVEDDGLDYFDTFVMNGTTHTLLSNNVPVADRTKLNNLYRGIERHQGMALFAGLWIAFEAQMRVCQLRKLAIGWRVLATLGLGWAVGKAFSYRNAQYYGPALSAYFRKYSTAAKEDLFEIRDPKREYFQIDDSQYMNYTHDDLGHEAHIHHGPQPDGEAQDATWLVEMDKFLSGQENNLKNHPRFLNYEFEFHDKSYPTEEMAHDLFHAKY